MAAHTVLNTFSYFLFTFLYFQTKITFQQHDTAHTHTRPTAAQSVLRGALCWERAKMAADWILYYYAEWPLQILIISGHRARKNFADSTQTRGINKYVTSNTSFSRTLGNKREEFVRKCAVLLFDQIQWNVHSAGVNHRPIVSLLGQLFHQPLVWVLFTLAIKLTLWKLFSWMEW